MIEGFGLVSFDNGADVSNVELIDDLLCMNLTSDMLDTLVGKFKRIIVMDMNEVDNISEWITDTNYNERYDSWHVTIEYMGPQTDIMIKLDKVNKYIRYLLLPIEGRINELINNNPHLNGVGINGDIYTSWQVLPISYIKVWVSIPYMMDIITHLLKVNHFDGKYEYNVWK